MPRSEISYPKSWQLQRCTNFTRIRSKVRSLMNHLGICTNDQHERAHGYCCLSTSCLLLQSGFEETESFCDSRSPLYVENPPLCQRPVGRHSPVTRWFPHTATRNVRICQIIIKTPHARTIATCFRVGKYLPSYIVDEYLTVSYVQNLLFAHRPRFNSLSLLLSVTDKRRYLLKLKYNSVIKVIERRREYFVL